jgi:DNA-binding transcriptional regulator YiaG
VSRKLGEERAKRIVELKERYQLTVPVIATRLGVSERTVWNYVTAHRAAERERLEVCTAPV